MKALFLALYSLRIRKHSTLFTVFLYKSHVESIPHQFWLFQIDSVGHFTEYLLYRTPYNWPKEGDQRRLFNVYETSDKVVNYKTVLSLQLIRDNEWNLRIYLISNSVFEIILESRTLYINRYLTVEPLIYEVIGGFIKKQEILFVANNSIYLFNPNKKSFFYIKSCWDYFCPENRTRIEKIPAIEVMGSENPNSSLTITIILINAFTFTIFDCIQNIKTRKLCTNLQTIDGSQTNSK